MLLISCSQSKKEDVNIFDPDAPSDRPGGYLFNLIDFNASLNDIGGVDITYRIPALYKGQDYKVHIYRVSGDGVDYQLPDPAEPYSSAYLSKIGEGSDTSFSDLKILPRGSVYTYYGYIELNEKWSDKVTSTVNVDSYELVSEIPRTMDFWTHIKYQDFAKEQNDTIFVNTRYTDSILSDQNSAMAFTDDGFRAYYADTFRNRIIILENSQALSCFQFEGDLREFCLDSVRNFPLSPVAVLGQASLSSSYSCQDPENTLNERECLTSPRDILVHNGSLVVATDDGVRIYDSLPRYGCRHLSNETGRLTDYECEQDRVIGKADFSDNSTYSIDTHGDRALFCATGLAARDNDLYISEKCNNRIVIAKNVFVSQGAKFECLFTTWGTSKCRFDNVLGQASAFENYSLQDRLSLDDIDPAKMNYDIATNSFSPSGMLSKICSSPTQIGFLNSGRFFALCNEEFSQPIADKVSLLEHRIQMWETIPISGSFPACFISNPGLGTLSNFYTEPRCQSSLSLGQVSEDSPSLIGDSYKDNGISFKNIRITQMDDKIIAAESHSGDILIWDQIVGNQLSYDLVFYDSRVQNPNGERSSGGEVILPDLKELGNIYWNPGQKRLYIQDLNSGINYLLNFDKRI
jgi:hypothetical protein